MASERKKSPISGVDPKKGYTIAKITLILTYECKVGKGLFPLMGKAQRDTERPTEGSLPLGESSLP
jgi:hypothetical protein